MKTKTGAEKIAEIISEMKDDLRLSNARSKLINMQRLKSSLESFSDIDVASIFHVHMHVRERAIASLDRAIADQERHIKWLEQPKREIKTTPEQDASINEMYKSQQKDAEKLGLPTFTND